jgi:hypothetical protein
MAIRVGIGYADDDVFVTLDGPNDIRVWLPCRMARRALEQLRDGHTATLGPLTIREGSAVFRRRLATALAEAGAALRRDRRLAEQTARRVARA